MATLIQRIGGNLKVTIDSEEPKYFNLNNLELRISGNNVYLRDGSFIDYNDSSPVFASAEALADAIGVFIYQYNTGV